MKKIASSRAFALMRWMCVLATICSLGQFTQFAAAQTPTPAPTWTPTITPTGGAPTPTSSATPTGRIVDFTVDVDEITDGECVSFSWVVKGASDTDTFVVKFDNKKDDFDPVLVPSEVFDRAECPGEDTLYVLAVTWGDGGKSEKGIDIQVDPRRDGNGDGGTAGSTPTPGTPPAFVPVTPISVVVTPVGPLGSVQVLPETGSLSRPTANRDMSGVAVGLALFLSIALLGLTLLFKINRRSEAPDEN